MHRELRVLLEETFPAPAVGTTQQRERPIAKMRQHARAHRSVIAREVELGQTRFWIEQLARVRDRDARDFVRFLARCRAPVAAWRAHQLHCNDGHVILAFFLSATGAPGRSRTTSRAFLSSRNPGVRLKSRFLRYASRLRCRRREALTSRSLSLARCGRRGPGRFARAGFALQALLEQLREIDHLGRSRRPFLLALELGDLFGLTALDLLADP